MASRIGDLLTLSWNASSDAQTPAAGLSYNLRVGTTPGGCDIVPPMALRGTGYRQVVQLGNAQQRTSWTIRVSMVTSVATYYWGVQAVDGAWAGSRFATRREAVSIVTAANPPRASSALRVNATGSSNPAAAISFDVPIAGQVELGVFDVTGRRVRRLIGEDVPAGRHEVLWDGTDGHGSRVAAGVYFCRMEAGSFTETRVMTLVR